MPGGAAPDSSRLRSFLRVRRLRARVEQVPNLPRARDGAAAYLCVVDEVSVRVILYYHDKEGYARAPTSILAPGELEDPAMQFGEGAPALPLGPVHRGRPIRRVELERGHETLPRCFGLERAAITITGEHDGED